MIMKHLRKFETDADVQDWQMSEDHVKPNVVLVGDTRSVLYNVKALSGVMIHHIDGSLYTTDEWTAGGFANSEANGVAVIDDRASFVLPKTQLGNKKWSSELTTIENIVTSTNKEIAKEDYNGRSNTEQISSQLADSLASSCINFVFPNGEHGYLPALGELLVMRDYISTINEVLSLVGGTLIKIDEYSSYWSSTQGSMYSAWVVYMGKELYTDTRKSYTYQGYNNYYAIAFGSLNI